MINTVPIFFLGLIGTIVRNGLKFYQKSETIKSCSDFPTKLLIFNLVMQFNCVILLTFDDSDHNNAENYKKKHKPNV